MTADELVIREATPDDWPRLWPIVRAVAESAQSYMIAPGIPEADARAYWMGAGLRTFIAELDGATVGTYILRPNQPGLGSHVANAGYMVAPGCDGKGVGARLAEHSFEVARASGFLAMQFNAVVSTNNRAVELWKRLGFAIVGTVPGAYRVGPNAYVDVHIMHRKL